jgi:NADH-quinone oxidoreductase subunit N
LLFGSILAISQTNIHRFFAATSITHMGFLLLGLKINLYLINYEKSNSFNILYSYFILYLLHTFIIFFILIFWSGLLNSYINQIYYNYRTNFFFNLNFNFIKDFIWFNLFSKKIIIIFLLLLFNLSGFPPFSFFYIKLNLIFLFLYNYAYFDAIGSLYFSIIITGSYIRLISLIYLENNYSNFNNKTFFKYIYQLILLNTNNHTKIKQIYTNVEYWLLIITFSLLFYNYTIYLF